MYGNNFYVKGYTPKYPFVVKFNSLSNAEKYAKNLIKNGYYIKSEIFLINSIYKLGDYLIKAYIYDNGKIIEKKRKGERENV